MRAVELMKLNAKRRGLRDMGEIMKLVTALMFATLALAGCGKQASEATSDNNSNQSNEDIKMASWSIVDCGKRKPCFEGVVQNNSNSTPAFIYARFAVFDAQNNQLGILEPRIDSLSPGARGKFQQTTYYPEMSSMKFIGFKVTP